MPDRPDWLTVILTRGLFGLPNYSPFRFLFSFLVWGIFLCAVIVGMLAVILDSAHKRLR